MAKDLRQFSGSTNKLIERAHLFHDTLQAELADFTAQFPQIDAAWFSDFKAAIDSADDQPSDTDLRLDRQLRKAALDEAIEAARAALSDLNLRARLAFADNAEMQRSFGQDRWPRAWRVPNRMEEALRLARDVANEPDVNAALLAQGMNQAQIDNLGTLAGNLNERTIDKNIMKLDRQVATSERIRLMNAVYAKMKEINTCAQLVWRGDEVRRRQYRLGAPESAA